MAIQLFSVAVSGLPSNESNQKGVCKMKMKKKKKTYLFELFFVDVLIFSGLRELYSQVSEVFLRWNR